MTVNNWPKLFGVLIFLVGLFVLIIAKTITFEQAAPFFTLILGYLVGNGVAAKSGDSVQPILGKKPTDP